MESKLTQRILAIAIFVVIVCNGWLVWQLIHWFEEKGVQLAWFWR